MTSPRHTLSGRDGRLRILDGSAVPNFIEIPFVQMNLTLPMARPRPADPIVVTEDGYTHLPDSGYDAGFFEPQQISFSAWVDEDTNSWKLRDALNADMDSPWKVGTTTWTSAKGQGGSIIVGDGNYVMPPSAFFDPKKMSVNAECLWENRYGGSAWGVQIRDIYFPPHEQTITESSEVIELQLKGLAYGPITAIAALTPGTES